MESTTAHPADVLRQKADEWQCSVFDRKFAQNMDEADQLAPLRKDFFYPLNKELPLVDFSLVDEADECVYLCGNSLGLQPRRSVDIVNRELQKWAKIGVHGHVEGEMPWALCDERVDEDMAKLVGANKAEVAVMNGLTVNQHLLLISFYRPTASRYKILMENHAFPSDHYAVESQIRLHGYDPATSMICMKPREGENMLRLDDILDLIEKEGDSIATIMWPGVQYYTGQSFDLAAITRAGHAKGCLVGFDLAHAVGNVPIDLHDWGVDFACWCSYKYVNSGAGGIAGAFVHEKHFSNTFPKLHGWWSHRMATRFRMDNKLETGEGATAYRVSNPPPLLCATLRASLDVFAKTSMQELRAKSKLLTGYLDVLLAEYFPRPAEGTPTSGDVIPFVDVITPCDPDQRGCQLSLMFSVPIETIHNELQKRGVVIDERKPNVLRVAPAPLYNSFNDVFRFVKLLQEAIHSSL